MQVEALWCRRAGLERKTREPTLLKQGEGRWRHGKQATDAPFRSRRGSGAGMHARWKTWQHGKPCRWRAHANRHPARVRPGWQGGGQARMTEDAG